MSSKHLPASGVFRHGVMAILSHAFAMGERKAGSDIKGVQARAEDAGDGRQAGGEAGQDRRGSGG